MSYVFFGQFGEEPEDIVLKTAKKQKLAAEVAHAVMSPITFAVKKGVTVAAAGRNGGISDEQYVRAIIMKIMKDNSLIPDRGLKAKIRGMIKEILREELVIPDHPHWSVPNYKKNGFK